MLAKGLERWWMVDTIVTRTDDILLDWNQINWTTIEEAVNALRQRIFAASRLQDWKTVRGLQKLMLRSRANVLVSVRRVTQINQGHMTAGVDGRVVIDSQGRAMLADWLIIHAAKVTASPVRRVYIPKADGRRRPLGIPVIIDRAVQAMVVNALEPEWEARFSPDCYGFRPGRGCHDAIAAIRTRTRGGLHRTWILDADLKAAFDHVDHDFLLGRLEGFPARELIKSWLRAGVVEQGVLTATVDGVPQGGVISPLLLNIALHGLEDAAGVERVLSGARRDDVRPGCPVVVVYADDLVVLCYTPEQAAAAKTRLTGWLAERGLVFNDDKTQIVSLSDGFDFLGFNVRRYPCGKTLIKPSSAALIRIRRRLHSEVKALHGANAGMVIARLNPIIKGWAAYYRIGVSSRAYACLDHYLHGLLHHWAKRAHPHKSKRWRDARYFGRFNPKRQDRWVFGDRDTGAYLHRFAWTRIKRHVKVAGRASPDDPDLTQYWQDRRSHYPAPVADSLRELLHRQNGYCPRCGGLLLHSASPPNTPGEWEQWHRGVKIAYRHLGLITTPGTPDSVSRLIHTRCQPPPLAHGLA